MKQNFMRVKVYIELKSITKVRFKLELMKLKLLMSLHYVEEVNFLICIKLDQVRDTLCIF